MSSMRCPACQAIEEDSLWRKDYPAKVAADFSRFIDCSPLFAVSGMLLCSNCGVYLQVRDDSGAANTVGSAELSKILHPSLCARFEDILEFPPDLIRVVTNELALGNEAVEVVEQCPQMVVLTMRWRFLDGHIVSSWVERQVFPATDPWSEWYLCPAASCAVACPRTIQ